MMVDIFLARQERSRDLEAVRVESELDSGSDAYDDMDSDDEGGSNDGFIDDTELGAIVDEGFRSKQTKVCILYCVCTAEFPTPHRLHMSQDAYSFVYPHLPPHSPEYVELLDLF